MKTLLDTILNLAILLAMYYLGFELTNSQQKKNSNQYLIKKLQAQRYSLNFKPKNRDLVLNHTE